MILQQILKFGSFSNGDHEVANSLMRVFDRKFNDLV